MSDAVACSRRFRTFDDFNREVLHIKVDTQTTSAGLVRIALTAKGGACGVHIELTANAAISSASRNRTIPLFGSWQA